MNILINKNNFLFWGSLGLAVVFIFGYFFNAVLAVDSTGERDATLYEKYEKFKKWEKYNKYNKYKKYKKKYGFKASNKRREYRQAYKNYKKYKKHRFKYRYYSKLKKKYKRYKKYRKYVRPYRKYKKYKKYNKKKYNKEEYKNYGTSEYKEGWLRYKNQSHKTQADLGGGNLGPDITVGLFKFSKNDLKGSAFRIKANKDYLIKDPQGNTLGTILAGTETRVKYVKGGKLLVNGSVGDVIVDREVRFEAVGTEEKDQIFEVVSPGIICYSDNCNTYRGQLKLRYSPESKKIWLINTLPLEQYVWGMGEITGTGDGGYNDVMTIAYRTYGYWKIKYSTKYASEGFKVNATPGNQLYFGYKWESGHERIKKAAHKTRGKIVMYEDRIAIVPYSSWTDGRTRSWRERWGSSNYPWCQSVRDNYGKHPSKKTKQLVAEGNHMVGLSAHGALHLADKKDWGYEKILKYYLKGIGLRDVY